MTDFARRLTRSPLAHDPDAAGDIAWFEAPIPGAFWQALKDRGLLREDAPVPAG